MTRTMRLSPEGIVSLAGGTYPIPGMRNGPLVLPSACTRNAVVHMHEVSTVSRTTAWPVGLVTVNSLVTLPFFIEMVPKSWKTDGATSTLFCVFDPYVPRDALVLFAKK